MHFDLLELGETALRLGVALLLGSAIGFERQWNQKMAGLRTNALVALGAAGFVTFSGLVGAGDPTRVAAQVVTGIGFLGAGVILREGVNVHGLNTAATLWCSAMVGTMAGAGHGSPALLAAGMVIATNLILRPLIPSDRTHDSSAHRRLVMDAILCGVARRSVQALQQASTMAS